MSVVYYWQSSNVVLPKASIWNSWAKLSAGLHSWVCPLPHHTKVCIGHDCSLWTALLTPEAAPLSLQPPTSLGCQPCYLCACLLTLKQSLPSLPPTSHQLYCILTQLGSTSHPQPLQVLNWKWRPAKGPSVLDKRSLCFPVLPVLPVLPPCPETTRLSLLLCWVWEGPCKSHASKCLLMRTIICTCSDRSKHSLWSALSLVLSRWRCVSTESPHWLCDA